MTIKKHMMALALATSMTAAASVAAMAQSADKPDGKVDNQNSVSDPSKPNSGPGVQGPADTRTGPSTRAPGGTDAGEGASTGAGDGASGAATTQPSQDSSGVEGLPGNKSGAAAKPDKAGKMMEKKME